MEILTNPRIGELIVQSHNTPTAICQQTFRGGALGLENEAAVLRSTRVVLDLILGAKHHQLGRDRVALCSPNLYNSL